MSGPFAGPDGYKLFECRYCRMRLPLQLMHNEDTCEECEIRAEEYYDDRDYEEMDDDEIAEMRKETDRDTLAWLNGE